MYTCSILLYPIPYGWTITKIFTQILQSQDRTFTIELHLLKGDLLLFRIIKNIRNNVREHIRYDRSVFIIYSVLRVLIILAGIRAIFNGNYNGAAYCLLSLLLFLVPSLMEHGFSINIPPMLEGSIYLFIFAAEILGEVNHFYVSIPGWDTMLHTINGFLAAAVGFSTVELLNRNSKNMNLSPFYLSMVAFCFSMTIGVLWEFWEFAMDNLFAMDMQKDVILTSISSVTLDPDNVQTCIGIKDIVETHIITGDGTVHVIEGGYLDVGIADTMKDLFVNFLGALVFCIFGYFMDKHDTKNGKAKRFAEDFIVTRVSDDADVENYALTNDDGFAVDEEGEHMQK